MTISPTRTLVLLLVVLLQQSAVSLVAAFSSPISTVTFTRQGTAQQQQQHGLAARRSSNNVDEEENDDDSTTFMTRRNIFQWVAVTTAGVAATTTAMTEPAHATYSAYTRREQDWQERQKDGNVQYKTATDLRSELRQIAPMNSERSRIFCPNGPSSNVSPLMENKCSDAMAMPSVYGRSDDVLGNSIPGFSDGRSDGRFATSLSSSLAADAGGFPTYEKNKKR